jgi:hypothetical protein
VDAAGSARVTGRAEHQAPEVDGDCELTGEPTPATGELVTGVVTASDGVDLVVEVKSSLEPGPGTP